MKCFSLQLIILFFTQSLFLGANSLDSIKSNQDKMDLDFKQRHSSLILSSSTDNLYSDAIRIKKNLSSLQDIQKERFLNQEGIPANELYQGSWENNRVHVYADLQNRPDTFLVNLQTFEMPISKGYVTSKFGPRGRRMHLGIDLKVQVGDTIYAAFEGKIRVKKFEKRGYGKYLVLRHPNGLETVYGHLSDYLVDVDQDVRAGEPIALGGNTGRSTGSHLHFEMRFLGLPINPADLVDFENFRSYRDQYVVTPTTFKLYNTHKAMKFHSIRKGDSLSKIARSYGTSVATLCRLNKISTKSTLKVGSKLRVN